MHILRPPQLRMVAECFALRLARTCSDGVPLIPPLKSTQRTPGYVQATNAVLWRRAAGCVLDALRESHLAFLTV